MTTIFEAPIRQLHSAVCFFALCLSLSVMSVTLPTQALAGDMAKSDVKQTPNEDEKILALARDVIKTARYATLVTIDSEGQPRTRIVDPFLPNEEFIIYVATKPVTRKVQQIRANDRVSLFYFDAEGRNSVSVMGRAELIDELDLKRQMRRDADSDKIYPKFPQDYLLIKIVPIRVEGLLPGYRGDRETWVQVGVNFGAAR